MADEQGLDQDRLVWMFTQMLRIREFEERVKRSFAELPGLLRGHTHLADGAEASIVGSLAALRPGDQILTTYRCHGYPIVLGTDPKAMMAEIFGKRTGLCGGYEVADAGFGYLKAPIKQVTGLDTPIPYSKPMEEHVLPNEDKIVEAVRQVLSTTLVT